MRSEEVSGCSNSTRDTVLQVLQLNVGMPQLQFPQMWQDRKNVSFRRRNLPALRVGTHHTFFRFFLSKLYLTGFELPFLEFEEATGMEKHLWEFSEGVGSDDLCFQAYRDAFDQPLRVYLSSLTSIALVGPRKVFAGSWYVWENYLTMTCMIS